MLVLLILQALPIFLDKLVDPVTAVVLSVTVVLVIGKRSLMLLQLKQYWLSSTV